MKKSLLSCILAAFLSFIPLSQAFGGVDPSPFDIIRDRITLIGSTFTLPDTLSLQTITERLTAIELNPEQGWVTTAIANQGVGIISTISGVLTAPDSAVTNEEAVQLVTTMDRISAVLFDPQPEPPRTATQALDIMERISAVLFAPQPEPPRLLVQGIDVMDRMSAVAFAPQPEPPRLISEGIGTLDRISAILFDPQPEPPGIMIQGFDIMERISSVLFAPQPEPPRVASKVFDIMDRISAVLFAPQPEPPRVASQAFDIMDRISAVLFAPQPEPPRVASQAFNVMDRISAVLFEPQPEPPRLPFDLEKAISVEYRVAGAMEQVNNEGLPGDKIPGLTALDQLSVHLVTAVAAGKLARASAQVEAMSNVSMQLNGY